MARVAAVVLAAGEATRFGSPKQHLLLPQVLERLAETSVDEIVVVEGAHPLDEREGIRIARCAAWARGPGASLRCGLEALADDVDAAVVILADGPSLAPGAVDRIVGAWRPDGGIVAASYAGARGHPLVVGRAAWGRVPDEGLRALPARLVPCDDLGAPGDVDTPDDLADLEKH
jgi:CTP:molybdopterin cytidylyltransferase MocA